MVGSAGATPPPLVPVVIRGEAGPLVVDIYPPKAKPLKEAPIARCTGPCTVMLPAGRYRLYVHEGEGTVSGSQIVDVARPVTLTVSPKTMAHRVGGLVLGIGGPALVLAGGATQLSGLCGTGHGDTDCGDTSSAKSTGTGLLLIGGLMTVVGWLLYSQSFKAGVKETPLRYGLAPTLFPRESAASDHVPGFVFTGKF
jgi:hypothetical protein